MPNPSCRLSNKNRVAAILWALSSAILLSRSALGGEPAQEFVNQLRNAGYFDTAVAYLNRIDRYPGVPQLFIDAIPLEKAQTYIDAAVAARSTKERDAMFGSAEEELKKFLNQSDHPRLSEARLQLGKLQLVRASQLMAAADPTDDARAAARQSYLNAAATFDSIVAHLRQTLEEMQGRRIDPAKEPEKVAQREQYRYEFLQAQVHSGEAKQLAAQTHRDPAKDGKPLLEEALKAFTELSEKYSDYLQGAQAMLYRGQVHRSLGNQAEAIDSFQRVLERPEVDPLRSARMQAMAGLVDLRLAAQPPQIVEAIAQAKKMVDSARPNEKGTPEFAALQVALAKGYFAAAEQAKAGGKQAEARKVTTTARPLLTAAIKIPGAHESVAREMLGALGIERNESAGTATAVDPKSLEEAVVSARDLLQINEELTKARQMLADQVAKGGEDGEQAAQELEAVEQQLRDGRATLVALLRKGLAIGDRDADRLNQARQYLAYILFQRGDYWESAAVGHFLSRSAANKQEGLRGGLLALASMQNLLRELPKESSAGVIKQIESLGEHLTRTWPNDPQAASAKGIMIRLALDDDRWDDARALLEKMPEGAERATYQRLMGQLLWNRSLLLRQEGQEAEGEALLPAAANELRAGLEGIPGALSGAEALQAALVLAKVELRRGDPAAALKVLQSPKYGPSRLVDKLGEPSDGFKSDLHSVELQAIVGVMTAEGSDTQQLLQQATAVMDRLQASVKDKPDANDRLVRIYIGLAKDIRDQLDAADADRKTKLIAAFRVFLDSIAKSSNEPATLQWVGQTLMQLGESSMAKNQVRAQGQAAELLASSTQTFESLRERLGAEAPATLQFQLGRAYRLSGEYKKSIDLFEEILKKSPMMLDTQIEAAKAYQQWAGVVDHQFAARAYSSALSGARPGPDGTNIIWGWGRISKMVSGRPEFREKFFEARYHVALCRFLMGKAQQSDKVIEQAANDITQVAALYPELGGPERREQFDLLLKEIQRTLGKKTDGLTTLAQTQG
jgi:hypothetical protein